MEKGKKKREGKRKVQEEGRQRGEEERGREEQEGKGRRKASMLKWGSDGMSGSSDLPSRRSQQPQEDRAPDFTLATALGLDAK